MVQTWGRGEEHCTIGFSPGTGSGGGGGAGGWLAPQPVSTNTRMTANGRRIAQFSPKQKR
tara:strand:+ start:24319 stop:24498 length:180 start_codon:yes stop_codon:yes gene_type:complete